MINVLYAKHLLPSYSCGVGLGDFYIYYTVRNVLGSSVLLENNIAIEKEMRKRMIDWQKDDLLCLSS